MKVIKPLLASKAVLEKIKYPVLVTPKLDGIRCLMVDGVAMSRSMKPIPNKHVQKMLNGLHGLDGELMIDGDFNTVQSGIMKESGEPKFYYCVFDSWNADGCTYEERVELVEEYLSFHDLDNIMQTLVPLTVYNEHELLILLDQFLEQGYEGLMIRQPKSPYKFGRSTVNEGILLKLKKFLDSEGVLVKVNEAYHNNNEQEVDELGYSKRSSCKENLIPSGTAGSVIINWQGKEFRVGFGPGFTDAKKLELWNDRESLIGKLVKFSYQELSKDGIPRFGKMLEIRHEYDL